MSKVLNYEERYILINRIEYKKYEDKNPLTRYKSNIIVVKDYIKGDSSNTITNIDEIIVYNLGRGNKPKLTINIYNSDNELLKRKLLFYGKRYSLYSSEYNNNLIDLTIECNGSYIIEFVQYTDTYKKILGSDTSNI